jgi:hypothetical protein
LARCENDVEKNTEADIGMGTYLQGVQAVAIDPVAMKIGNE